MKTRPDLDQYFLGIADAVATRADCVGRQVGAVLVQGERIIATGYNGTPTGLLNCTDGGCHRCTERDRYPSGTSYDLCVCVHAEANVLASAARFGIATEDATLYCTHQPCFGCAKELLQAGVSDVVYREPWQPNPELKKQYGTLLSAFKGRCRLLPALVTASFDSSATANDGSELEFAKENDIASESEIPTS